MKKFSMRNICLILCILILVVTASICTVYAFDASKQNVIITDAIKAADVCEEHLAKDCTICNGYEVNSSYRTVCPTCNKDMMLCCSGSVAVDDNRASCLVLDHPSGCETIQDLYWNAYYCNSCGYYQRGYRSDEYHVEAYWHTKADCYDHAYCSLPRLSDLTNIEEKECLSEKNSSNTYSNPIDAAIAASDYCEVHDIFACNIPHED